MRSRRMSSEIIDIDKRANEYVETCKAAAYTEVYGQINE